MPALPARLDDIEFNARIGGLLDRLGLTLYRLRRFAGAAEVRQGAASVLERMGRAADAARVAGPARSRHLDGIGRLNRM